MSELRVDNIVSADGTAAPIYSKGMNIGVGQTLTNNGNFVVGGATSIAGNVQVSGASTFTGAVTYSSNATINGNVTINGTLTNNGTFSYSSLNVSGDATVGGNLTVNGTTTTIDTVNLVVEDKNIGIGTTSTPSNSTADGGGLTLFGGTDGDKTITWQNSTGDWNVDGGGLRIQGKGAATTGKAIAMAMVFGA